MNINKELEKIKNSEFILSGGIGIIISHNEDTIYKLLFFETAYLNNIDMYNKIKDKIDVVDLKGYFVHSDIYISNNSEEQIKSKLDKVYKDELYKLYLKNKNNIKLKNGYLYIYVLKYEKMNNNCYHLLKTILDKSNHDNIEEFDQLFSFFIVWICNVIYYLNTQLNVYHNDLKLDNILIKQKQDKTKITKIKINNIYLYNRTMYEFYLNDFDMSLGIKCDNDFNKIKSSLNKLFHNKRQNKFIKYIFGKLNSINDETEIFDKWLNKSTLFQHVTTNNIINEFLNETTFK